MPPTMPSSSKRMTANPARPVARYRPGKGAQEESSEDDEEEEESDAEARDPPKSRPDQPKATSFPSRAPPRNPSSQAQQESESDDEEGFITEDEGDDDTPANTAALATTAVNYVGSDDAPAVKDEMHDMVERRDDSEDSQEETSAEEESSSEESSSEEEGPQRKFQRPKFIKKSARAQGMTSAQTSSVNGTSNMSLIDDHAASDETRRKELADLMIKDKLERDAAARAAGRKAWDDDDEVAPEDMVDDTDGLDPDAEYAAWKLRELKRLKRDREAIEQREKEIEEIERRRNLTQEERDAEDREYLEQQKEERDATRGESGFMQKYHHKGAFFQDNETAEMLRKRDLMGSKSVDEIKNREALPQYMQIRDMTKLGKKGRTRYKDLRNEDTGRWGEGYDRRDRKGPSGDFTLDERFRPDRGDGSVRVSTGANSATVGDKRQRNVGAAPSEPRAVGDGNHNKYTDAKNELSQSRRRTYDEKEDRNRPTRRSRSPRRTRSYSRSRSRSTGRSSRRDGDDYHKSRRKRSPSSSSTLR